MVPSPAVDQDRLWPVRDGGAQLEVSSSRGAWLHLCLQPARPSQRWALPAAQEAGRSPGGGHGNPLQYSCLENPLDRGAWWATVHVVAKTQTRLSDWTHSRHHDAHPITPVTQQPSSSCGSAAALGSQRSARIGRRLNHPQTSHPPAPPSPGPREAYPPRSRSLVPERLGCAGLEDVRLWEWPLSASISVDISSPRCGNQGNSRRAAAWMHLLRCRDPIGRNMPLFS